MSYREDKLLEAGGDLIRRIEALFTLVYPKGIFQGCDGCEEGSCDTDEGVRAIRRVRNGVDGWKAVVEFFIRSRPADNPSPDSEER